MGGKGKKGGEGSFLYFFLGYKSKSWKKGEKKKERAAVFLSRA